MALGIDLGSFDSKMVELVESNDAIQGEISLPVRLVVTGAAPI